MADKPKLINWSELRAAAIGLGNIREAARQAARNLTPQEQERFVFRVLKRAAREKWIEKAKGNGQLVKITNEKPLSSNILTGSEALRNCLEDDNRKTKMGLSRATRRAAETFEQYQGETVIENSRQLKDIVGAASQIHAWEKEEEGSGTLSGLKVYSKQTVIQVNQGNTSDETQTPHSP